jgi:hypothetical protein
MPNALQPGGRREGGWPDKVALRGLLPNIPSITPDFAYAGRNLRIECVEC